MRISDWSSDVCSSDLQILRDREAAAVMRGDVDPPGPQRAARRAAAKGARVGIERNGCQDIEAARAPDVDVDAGGAGDGRAIAAALRRRSEEHTSELQSLMRISYAVFCLKKKTTIYHKT